MLISIIIDIITLYSNKFIDYSRQEFIMANSQKPRKRKPQKVTKNQSDLMFNTGLPMVIHDKSAHAVVGKNLFAKMKI